ncbi:hypothetical protein [Pseudoalteromonas umbrosa]|uniref:hypothetical protein n=1 Tax=Pseudoalteromonas umbrosa TaxID=3048489 RepID=UPI0024C429EE|nr:hypothetical protein [Pseudoalteromonas sp. B95]MDK1289807.1 hypothetical protein [Pseudoalteromonas sp. B95]
MNKQVLIEALNNHGFIRFFKASNGGFDPTDYPLLAQDEIYHLWVCSDAEFLASQEKHCTEGERAERLLKNRNLARAKLWRYFIAYTNTKLPGSAVAHELASQIKPWSASSQELTQVFHSGVEALSPDAINH